MRSLPVLIVIKLGCVKLARITTTIPAYTYKIKAPFTNIKSFLTKSFEMFNQIDKLFNCIINCILA